MSETQQTVVVGAPGTPVELTRDQLRERMTAQSEGAEITEEHITQAQQQWREMADRLAARGPVTLDFGPGAYGYVIAHDLVADAGMGFHATGRVEVGSNVDLIYAEFAALDPEVAARLPLDVLSNADFFGASDDLVKALAHNETARELTVTGVVSQALATELQEEPASRVVAGGALISDAAFAELANATEVTGVGVSGTSATDATVAAVAAALPRLTRLDVDGPEITGTFLASLRSDHLQVLGAVGARVRGEHLNRVATLPTVEHATFGGPHSLDGLDAAALMSALPALTSLTWRSAEGDEAPLRDLLPLHQARPGIEINGVELSPKAAERAARKLAATVTN